MDRSFRALGAAMLVAAFALAFGLAAASCGDSSKKPGCKADKDCKNKLVCSANTCVECTSDAQCQRPNHCQANACVPAPECKSDSECHGKVCQAGKCKACASDAECGPDSTCKAGVCALAKKCSKDDECADDEDCVKGLCRKGGAATNPGDASCTLATVFFGYDDSTVQASERDRLTANVACIEKTKGKNAYLIGYTDTSGTEEYNIALSERRAQAVADYMARLGSDPARLQVVPKGETEPTGLGDDKDRRVEFQWH